MNADNDKARMAALLMGLDDVIQRFKQREAQEMETGKCAECGTPLGVAWPAGQKDVITRDPLIFCPKCTEGEWVK
jgi:DNA-directed RNA polymerase subunit RPC12/RpoP